MSCIQVKHELRRNEQLHLPPKVEHPSLKPFSYQKNWSMLPICQSWFLALSSKVGRCRGEIKVMEEESCYMDDGICTWPGFRQLTWCSPNVWFSESADKPSLEQCPAPTLQPCQEYTTKILDSPFQHSCCNKIKHCCPLADNNWLFSTVDQQIINNTDSLSQFRMWWAIAKMSRRFSICFPNTINKRLQYAWRLDPD